MKKIIKEIPPKSQSSKCPECKKDFTEGGLILSYITEKDIYCKYSKNRKEIIPREENIQETRLDYIICEDCGKDITEQFNHTELPL